MRRFWTTKPLQLLFPEVIWTSGSNDLHLTFDDGPDPVATPKVLDVLAKHSLRATFFLLGRNVERHPEIVRRASEEGHTLGLHSFDHTRLAFRSRAMILDQLSRANNALEAATGKEATLFRPPYGFLEPSLLKHVKQSGLSTVMWDVDPGDSTETNVKKIVGRVASKAGPGSIILLHDNPNTRDRIDMVLDGILETLQNRSLKVQPLLL